MSDASPPRILVIMGSTRKGRIGPKIAGWVAGIGREATGGEFEIVDLRDWHLPVDDEPAVPATGDYANPHTQAWSQKVSQGDAVVFVTPQYNWGYPAPLKNALDHLYKEWDGKPAIIVSYGARGGGKCADQLRQVCEGGLDMRVAATMPALKLGRAMVEANDGNIAPETHFAETLPDLQRAFAELMALLPAFFGR